MADIEHSTIKHADHFLLDQSLLRLPNELLRKNFRAAHFTIEKDTTALKTLLKDSATAAISGRASDQDVLRNIDAMIARMRGVKRKLDVYATEEARLHEHAAARIEHLDELHKLHSVDDVKYEAWSRKRLDRLLADYLLRHGFNQSAAELAKERNMENLVDVDTFVTMSRIKNALANRSVTEALAWCTENKKELRKMESKLEFMLRFQQYIELIRTRDQSKLHEAIAHAQKYLIPHQRTYPKEFSQACGLLAMPPGSQAAASTYGHLYDDKHWAELGDLFMETHNNLLSLPPVPLLHVALSSGLSALKTPACHTTSTDAFPSASMRFPTSAADTNAETDGDRPVEHSQKESATTLMQTGVCPICSTELNDLARSVPYAHHTKSHVDNDLMLLPSGAAIGKSRLEDSSMNASFGPGVMRYPRTGEVFGASELKKVYIT